MWKHGCSQTNPNKHDPVTPLSRNSPLNSRQSPFTRPPQHQSAEPGIKTSTRRNHLLRHSPEVDRSGAETTRARLLCPRCEDAWTAEVEQGLPDRTGSSCSQARPRMRQNSLRLLASDTRKPLQEIIHSGAILKILEQGKHWDASAPEDKCPTDASWDGLDGTATFPRNRHAQNLTRLWMRRKGGACLTPTTSMPSHHPPRAASRGRCTDLLVRRSGPILPGDSFVMV